MGFIAESENCFLLEVKLNVTAFNLYFNCNNKPLLVWNFKIEVYLSTFRLRKFVNFRGNT